MTNLILSPISLDELESRIVNRFKSEFQIQTPPQSPVEDSLLTSRQSAKMLGVSLVTLSKWRTEGRIKFHRIGSRIRFKRAEVLDSLQSSTNRKGGRK
jgi:excisionase family DNA binding protein